ncbi:DUF4350 domain-containing protein [Gephyromycinifex aptenodytis]|uniref:DUF4350 domain-containing protein n=1 Tax=Gephyromycinifex aptenodytis TaxID=2716227 RepID=UPI0014453FBE|nr:DUF4350 domain-containing protein [Gephyromycinifex aptenodytis]
MSQAAAVSTRSRRIGAGWILIASLAALVLVLSALLLSPPAEPLSPQGTDSTGARALVRVLAEQQGVDVVTVATAEELRRLSIGPETTLFLPRAEVVSTSYAAALAESAGKAGRLVLVAARQPVLDRLGIPARERNAATLTAAAQCQADDVHPGDEVDAAEIAYEVGAETRATTCLASTGLFEEGGEPSAYVYVALPAAQGRPETVLFGSQRALTNRSIANKAHAGIALRMLSHTDRVVWVTPDPDDESGPLATSTPIPPWFFPCVAILGAALLTLCLWRGRRLGRLVREPLPVIVHAIETTAARGRLYQAAGEPAAALKLLQDDAVQDLRRALHLHPGADRVRVANAVADRLSRDPEEIRSLLTPHDTLDEADLVERASQLRRLRREVHE